MKKGATAAIVFALGFVTRAAVADDLPVPYASRPLTLPARMISPQLSGSLLHEEGLGLLGGTNIVGLNLGASYGVIDDLTVYATPLTMSVVTSTRTDPIPYYGTLRVGGIYRFVHTEDVDVGVQLELGGAGKFFFFHATAAVPVLFRIGHVVRIDTGVAFTMLFPTTRSRRVDGALASAGEGFDYPTSVAGFPIGVAIQPIDPIFFGVRTGLGIASLRGNVANTIYVPLGVFFGGTICSNTNHPIADITARFDFPFFLYGGAYDLPVTQAWTTGLDARLYFQL